MKAKKHLGQHFLTSKKTLHTMLRAGAIEKNDRVLEIGPGKGVLTRALLEAGSIVYAVETDADMVSILKESFQDELSSGRLHIVEGDVLSIDLSEVYSAPYKIIANIPYYITGGIIRFFLETKFQPTSMTLLVQKEVAARIARDRKESLLSISVKAYGAPRYVETVPARYFNPKPKVDSAILHIDSISKKLFSLNSLSEERFFLLVKSGFANKRKTLVNNLVSFASKEVLQKALLSLGHSASARAEELSVDEWFSLAKTFDK